MLKVLKTLKETNLEYLLVDSRTVVTDVQQEQEYQDEAIAPPLIRYVAVLPPLIRYIAVLPPLIRYVAVLLPFIKHIQSFHATQEALLLLYCMFMGPLFHFLAFPIQQVYGSLVWVKEE